MTNQQQYVIIAGPSREDLFDALRLRHEDRKVSFTVTFTPQQLDSRINMPNKTFDVFVNGISIEDGSGASWLLNLYEPNGNALGWKYLNGYFNTTTRNGWIKPITTH